MSQDAGRNGSGRNSTDPRDWLFPDDEEEESSGLTADCNGEQKAITAVINIYEESEDGNAAATARVLASIRKCGLAVKYAQRVVRRVLAEQALEEYENGH